MKQYISAQTQVLSINSVLMQAVNAASSPESPRVGGDHIGGGTEGGNAIMGI